MPCSLLNSHAAGMDGNISYSKFERVARIYVGLTDVAAVRLIGQSMFQDARR